MTRQRTLDPISLQLCSVILGFAVIIALGYRFLASTLRTGSAAHWLVLSVTTGVFEIGICWWAIQDHWKRTGRMPPVLGVANGLTLLRGVICALAAGFLFVPFPPGWLGWLPAVLCAFCGLLDYADGTVARRVGQETVLGSHLDIEFDAILTLVAAALCVHYGQVPAAYLGIGAARYVFVSGRWLRQRFDKPVYDLPESRLRRLLYAMQLGFSIGVLTPLVHPPITSYGALCVLVVFLSGFARDWLFTTGRFSVSSPPRQTPDKY